jgi:FAD/FMN-containing dehydrogenase
MSPTALDGLAENVSVLRPNDAGYDSYTRDVVLEGHPDGVLRPKNEAEVIRALTEAHRHRIPVTAAGGRTSLTGSSVALEGWLLATNGMNRVCDLRRDPETGGMVAVAEPGLFLGDLQRTVLAEGWFYPPDPTSRNEACLGATVATNATGEDTLRYGPTRRWIRELRVVTADGSVRTLRRSPESRPSEEKATAGYYLNGEEIDLLIGSEGTLGVITQVALDLIPRPFGFFAGIAFFPSRRSALEFVVRARESSPVTPRALELIDRASVELLEDKTEGIAWPDQALAAIVFKQEFADPRDREDRLGAWSSFIARHLEGTALADRTMIFETAADLERLRILRHRIPSAINETLEPYRASGGAKMGTDWWVPYRALPAFMDRWDEAVNACGLRTFVFGHVGNGHPHVNFLCRNREETDRARTLILAMCRDAVGEGGGVAGEHGLGKLKRDLLPVQWRPETIAEMREVKRAWDPGGILGRGNVFPEEASA